MKEIVISPRNTIKGNTKNKTQLSNSLESSLSLLTSLPLFQLNKKHYIKELMTSWRITSGKMFLKKFCLRNVIVS